MLDHLYGKLLFTWLVYDGVFFVLSFFPRGVLDEILNLIESVSGGFPSYSNKEGLQKTLGKLSLKRDCKSDLYVILAVWPPVLQYRLPALVFFCILFVLFLLFIVVMPGEPKQNQGRGLVDRKLV